MPTDSLTPFSDEDGITLFMGDCLDVLPLLPENSIDALVTDPPAGISFMSKHWDDFRRASNQADVDRDNVFGRTSSRGPEYGRSPRAAFVDAMTLIFRECLRVMKPGAHGLVWSIPRTSHWTAWALEDAGFTVRDRVSHLFGAGFPKSLSVSKALDAALGVEREVVGEVRRWGNGAGRGRGGQYANDYEPTNLGAEKFDPVTIPATDAARQWDGWGTALKPACEDWWLVRKPLIGTVAQNILEYDTGGLNIDGCRIGSQNGDDYGRSAANSQGTINAHSGFEGKAFAIAERDAEYASSLGRWPANLVLSHSEGCQLIGTKKAASNGHYPSTRGQGGLGTAGHAGQDDLEERVTKDEEVEDWRCVESCPVRMLNEQSGISISSGGGGYKKRGVGAGEIYGTYGERDLPPNVGLGDTGGAARFFYCAKSSVEDREQGLEDLEAKQRDESRQEGNPGGDNPRNRGLSLRKNSHPTVKNTELMRWLVRLITPPGGTVLDPFAGSGSTGKACALEGFKAILIERELEYAEIAKRRARLKQKRLF